MNASDQYLAGGQSLLYPLGSDHIWIGRPRGGMVLTEPREEQVRDINTNEPVFWDKERTQPKTQLVFTVACDGSGPAQQNGWHTDERTDAQDPGHRQAYIKGKDKIDAIKAEIHRHGLAQQGRPGIRVGDYYYECWTGTRPGKNNVGTARTWAVMLFPGVGQAQTQFYGNEQQPPAQHQQQAPAGFGQAPPAAPPVSPPLNVHNSAAYAQPQTHAPAAQGNAYGFGHQPPASPGGQAFQQAQQASQGFGQAPPNPGPPPQFGAPAPAQHQQAPAGFGQPQSAPASSGQFNQQAYAQQVVQGNPAPNGFGQAPPAPAGPPVPPVDSPWGAAAPNPYA